ncbi:MAG: lysophospholipase [Dehalococcoidia bacterium]|nr:lysophospholipase [Dehalococcoidia bacterium]
MTRPGVLALALSLLGCAPALRLSAPPLPPPHDAGTGWIEGAEHVRLFTSTRIPTAPVRGVVWLVVGPEVGSAPLYPRLTTALGAGGFVVATVHPRGAGYSSGDRGDIEDYALVLSDYARFHQHLRSRFPETPLFLLGHSAGGPLALEVAARAPGGIRGLVLVNPAYKLIYAEGMGPSTCDYVVYALRYLFTPDEPAVDMNSRAEAVRFAPDRAEALAMQADPLVVRHFSMRYLFAQKGIMDAAARNAAQLDTPLLLVEGRHDALVDPKGNDEIFSASRSRDRQRLSAPEGGHGSSAVETQVEAIAGWLQAHAGEGSTPIHPEGR